MDYTQNSLDNVQNIENMSDSRYLELLSGTNESFRKVLFGLQTIFGGVSLKLRGKATHTNGVAAKGTLTVLNNLDIPKHAFFSGASSYDVITSC